MVRRMQYDFDSAVKTIETVVLEKGDRYLTLSKLANNVVSRLGLTPSSKTRTKTVISTLLAAKKLREGYYGIEINKEGNSEYETLKLQQEVAALKKFNDEATENLDKAGKLVKETVAELERIKNEPTTFEVVIKKQGCKTRKMDGHFHKQFKKIVALAQARKNIFIYGPTGSGKSFICSQVAEALGLPYYFVSCTAGMSEGVLGGRLLPVGQRGTFEYVAAEFINAYEKGGVFLLDEIDAADPNVLLLVNAALANGRMAVPNRPEKPYAKRHKDFICIAAANTVGTGGDRMYSGRNKLDAATLDRFLIGKVYLDYDRNVEEKLCPCDTLRTKLWKIREAIDAHRLERAMSTRFLIDAHDMQEAGWTINEIMEGYFCGWREDEKNKVLQYVAQN